MSASPHGPGADACGRSWLPRLAPGFYRGLASVHWTLTTLNRHTGWLDDAFHQRFRELLLHTFARGHLACPVYCLMPDHIHMIWMGLAERSDQMISIAFLDTHLEPLLAPAKFQPQPHDHVLRDEEREQSAFQNAAHYITDNPVRARLVREREAWPYLGCVVPGYPRLHPLEPEFWPKFWRIRQRLLIRWRSPA